MDLALEEVNEVFLKSHRIELKKVQGRWVKNFKKNVQPLKSSLVEIFFYFPYDSKQFDLNIIPIDQKSGIGGILLLNQLLTALQPPVLIKESKAL